MYRVLLAKEARKDLDRVPAHVAARVEVWTKRLRLNARPYGVEKLTNETPPMYRVRVGDYRMLYSIDDAGQEVLVARVVKRGEAYRR